MNRRTPATALFAVIALVIVVVLLAPATMGGVKKITTRPGVVTPPVFDVDDTGVPVTPPGGQLVPLPTPVPVPTNPQDLALHDTMRHLWMDHVVWSRNVTMGVFSDLKGVGDYEARLAMNTYDLTALLTPYFGKVNAATFEGLFMQHVTIASEVFQAYKEGNETFRDVSYRWYQNADEISAFLHLLDLHGVRVLDQRPGEELDQLAHVVMRPSPRCPWCAAVPRRCGSAGRRG